MPFLLIKIDRSDSSRVGHGFLMAGCHASFIKKDFMMTSIQYVRTFLRCVLVMLVLSPLALFAAQPLDINTATADQIAAVMSGVGDKKAQAIVAYRSENGPFKSLDQLTEVKGLGDALVERNKAFIQIVEPPMVDAKE
jgi:competence protein ComEA